MAWMKRAVRVGLFLLLMLYVAFMAFPLLWLVLTSLKTQVEVVMATSFWPQSVQFENYRDALFTQGIFQSVKNSLKVSLVTALATLAVAAPAAYVSARRGGLVEKLFRGWILASQTFPHILIIVPLFLILAAMALTNTHAGLSLVYVVSNLPFVLWMLFGYVRSVPVELEEAAAVDGASGTQTLAHILVPLMVPGLVATGMYAFITAWNEFFFALVLLKEPDLLTIQVNLARFRGVEGFVRWGPLAAGSVLATLPALAVFAVVQRGLIAGLMAGSLKQ
ncbi:carbohydrate ABC transporter permease [Limnochorda pilosa]|nr:carbohydrate ABC transporter permease [Limnochorda pilosa]